MHSFFFPSIVVFFPSFLSVADFICLRGLVWRHGCYLCALAWFARYVNCGADLFGAFFHADQSNPAAVYSVNIKTVAIIAELQVNGVGIKIELGLELGRMRVF